MELFTLNSDYGKLSQIDFFSSAIWTERVAGNGDFQISVPATPSIITMLSEGTTVGLEGSKTLMRVDTQTIKDNVLKVVGRSLEQNLNNRFIRFTAEHHDKSYSITGSPGYILQYLVQNMAVDGDWLNGIQNMGVANPQRFKIPHLSVLDWDTYLASVTIQVPYGSLFDALKQIADAYNLTQRIEWWGEDTLYYRNWQGVDHTANGPNELVRFSTQLDNFAGTTEVVDATKFKTHAFAFASGLAAGGNYTAGEDDVMGNYTGFDLRAELVFADDITSIPANVTNVLQQRAYNALASSPIVGAVDGQLLPTTEYIYGTHYNLGDIVETQGTSGIIQPSRVTEYIRSQDASGEKAYPTLVAVN